MWAVVIGLVVGNIIGGFFSQDHEVTMGILLGQLSTVFFLWLFGYTKERG
jgi:uncharacterized membrane protein